MRPIRTMKRHDDRIVFTLGVEGADDERQEVHVVPLGALASWGALLGISHEDALAAMLLLDGSTDDVTVPWPRLYDELRTPGADPASREVAREALGVTPGDGLAAVIDGVQLQAGRLDEIGAVIKAAPAVDTEMSPEDVALMVQVGDLRGKAQRYLASIPGAEATAEVDRHIAEMRTRSGAAT